VVIARGGRRCYFAGHTRWLAIDRTAGGRRRRRRAVTEESEHTAGGTAPADVPSRPRAHCSICHPLPPPSPVPVSSARSPAALPIDRSIEAAAS